ncbi:unnamed protein product [Paramecium octaurelia]|uniref:Uncharacterized protein n=1 Tax=Paramecium octaurelia TaxID=43137 RepID=A0A8S1W9C2_PAROT|nr:unnamed protein product [Paramecium octaurelia]
MQKLEKCCEQLKTQLSESQQEQTKNKGNLKQNLKLNKSSHKNKVKYINQQEFDISKARSIRQLKLRESEIFKLKQEFIDIEHNFHNKTEHTQLETSSTMLNSLIDGVERRNFSGIFTQKRNLVLELYQLITKSNYLVESDQKLKLDVHTQTDEKYECYNFIKKQDSSFQEEILSSQLSFWKPQCSDLLAERALYEEKQNQLQNEMKELQIKLEQFFIEQHKYEQELQEAKNKVLNLIEDNNVIRSQFEQSLQKIVLQDRQLVEFQLIKEQLEETIQYTSQKKEEQLKSKKKKKVWTIQSSLMNKQLEITQRDYYELLQIKQEEIQLLTASIEDIIINYNVSQIL